jgi:hypothetical protein
MFLVQLVEQLVEVEFLAPSALELPDANIDFRAKLVQRFNALEQLSSELFLGGFRQVGGLCHCKLKCSAHGTILARRCAKANGSPIRVGISAGLRFPHPMVKRVLTSAHLW